MTTQSFVLMAAILAVSSGSTAPLRETRVTRTVRLENKATPSIEASWPVKAQLVARR